MTADRSKKHYPVAMEFTGPFAKQHTYRTGRIGSIWHYGYQCHVCKVRTSRVKNAFHRRGVSAPVCDGITYHETTGRPMKRPAKLVSP